MFDICNLHIGTEKTGSTSIQGFMRLNGDRLRERGFLYPQSLGPLNHRRLRNYSCNTHSHLMGAEVREHPEGIEGFRRDVRRDFEVEAQAAKCRALVVSDEHFHSSLTTLDEIHRLRSFIMQFSRHCRVVVYLRRQDELCRSFYTEYIKNGHSDDRPLFSNSVEYYYDYRALIENYESAFGSGNIVVRLFEGARLIDGDVIDDFAQQIGLGDIADWSRPDRSNVSLNALALRFLIAMNRHVPVAVDGRPNPDRARLRSLLEANFAGKGWPLPREWAVAVYDRHRPINEWVRQRFFPSAASLFEEDFSSYPVAVINEPFSFDDAVAVAAVLWTQQIRDIHALQSELSQLRDAVVSRQQSETGQRHGNVSGARQYAC